MKLLRAATLTVADPERSSATYAEWLDYREVESGRVPEELAASWGCPKSAGRPYRVLEPSSGAPLYLRFVQGDPVEGYAPLRTYGWNAIEICVKDVLAVNERMQKPGSPFEIIGPPREIEGLDAIYPMQVKGPDDEIAYFTQIRDDLPAYDLPRASSFIDKLFIMVLGASDLETTMAWLRDRVHLQDGRQMEIVYTMLAKAYGSDEDELHTIATMIDDKDVFLEVDQYPEAATPRPGRAGELPPGIPLATLITPHFAKIEGWLTEPAVYDGPVYGGLRAGTLRGPDDLLVELVEHV